MVRVKICCISDHAEAAMAVTAGASAVGLVSAMPSGPGVIDEERIAAIARTVPPAVATFLLTSERSAAAIRRQHRRCRTDTVQIVDELEEGSHHDLRESMPGVRLVQVIHVTGPEAVERAEAVAAGVDALLLDSGNPALAAKELGGTGRVHDWEVSRRIVERAPVPVFLAGGLTADNVAEAIERVRPFGVDVCSGVRSSDRLDPDRLAAFMAAVTAAEAGLTTGRGR